MTTTIILDAEHRIAQIERRAVDVCFAIRQEQQAIDDRDTMLSALVNSLIGQPNPLTNKPHSATSAEAAAKDTEQYKAAQAARLTAEVKRVMAWADYERARLIAKLAVVAAAGELTDV